MTNFLKLAAALMIAGFLAGGGASAAVIGSTVTGTLTSGADTHNYFGGSLGNNSVTIAYLYDTSKLGSRQAGAFSTYYQPNSSPAQNGAIMASVTINGISLTASSLLGNSSILFERDYGASHGPQYQIDINDSAGVPQIDFYDIGTGSYSPTNFATGPFAYDTVSSGYLNIGGAAGQESFAFVAISNSLTAPDLGQSSGSTAVPEPASLALLGAGLTGLGWLRRRTKIA